ncbi:sulfotransferase family domain-containing protein [Fusarium austroafricanum]|uniref:Sulfotransferase family domain-containing protein n=1 Tax=Fusarium austroafricanum TaxID=2364996 RepID=A0A8H4KIL9_9HYPO|nr:sulfotransferase family domain-containing protein [Fusarium austroafricanum]
MGSIEESQATETRTQDVFLFALNRTCSHVLCRLLSDQPGWVQSNYHFKRAFDFAREAFNWGPLNSVSDDQLEGFQKLLQEGFDEIQTELKSAKSENLSMFLKEHTFYIWEPSKLSQHMWGGPPSRAFTVNQDGSSISVESTKTNPTIFPDRWLISWRPIFLIRHPALTFESWYRAESGARSLDLADRSWAFYTTYQYSRQLYDWFLSNVDQKSGPIVIDADDILDGSSTIKKLCNMLGMDEKHILYKWDVIQAPENAGRRELKFMSDYWNSTSIDSSKSSRGLDMEAAYKRWEKDFGPEDAVKLQNIVEDSMADYNYLKEKKI